VRYGRHPKAKGRQGRGTRASCLCRTRPR
jgi:hypothetical protein